MITKEQLDIKILEIEDKIRQLRVEIKSLKSELSDVKYERANVLQNSRNQRLSYDTFVEKYYYNPIDGKIYNKDNNEMILHWENKLGAIFVNIFGGGHFVHRLAFLQENKEFPSEHVDHIDGNRSNNIRTNLRIASRVENGFNKKKYKCNSSGYKGVTWHKTNKKWLAQATYKRKTYNLGYYDEVEDAYKAYCKFCEEKHGEFVNLS